MCQKWAQKCAQKKQPNAWIFFAPLADLPAKQSCAKIWLMCFSVETVVYRPSYFLSHTSVSIGLIFYMRQRADSFCCCHNNVQTPHHRGQNPLTFMLRRPLCKQVLSLSMITHILSTAVVIQSGEIGMLLLGKLTQLRDSEASLLIFGGNRDLSGN